MSKSENTTYRVKTDGFFGELFVPSEDHYPGKALPLKQISAFPG